MSNIEYRPSLEYEKSYSTKGNLPSQQMSSQVPQDTYINKLQDLSDALNNIENSIKALPSQLYDAVKTPIAGVRYMLDDLGTGDIGPVVTSKIVQNGPASVIIPNPTSAGTIDQTVVIPGLEDMPTELFPAGDGLILDVQTVITPKTDVVDLEYKYDISCIFVDYLNNLQKIIGKFFNTMLVLGQQVSVPSFVNLYAYYDSNSKNVSDDMKPISDTVIRNQIIEDQKIRLYKKLFDVDSTVMHIRACKSAAELRKRYYTAGYIGKSSILNVYQNNILEGARAAYDKKYVDNLYNLYKYLNSSVILIDECIKTNLDSAQGKAALIKNEGVTLQW